MTSLIGKVLKNKSLPRNSEILKSTGNALKDFATNPVSFVRRGLRRDRIANQLYKNVTGQSRLQTTRDVLGKVGQGVYKGGGKDLAVNTGGFLGSKLGSVGGIPGQLAGDYVGARVTRRVLDEGETLQKAMKITNNPKFRSLPPRQKLQIIRKRVQGFRNSRKDDELFNDTAGWAIGNGSAIGLQKVGSQLPLQGGGVAIASLPSVRQGFNVARRIFNRGHNVGNAVKTGAVSTGRNLKKRLNPRRIVRRGLSREERMRKAINENLSYLPTIPNSIDFKRKTYFMVDLITYG